MFYKKHTDGTWGGTESTISCVYIVHAHTTPCNVAISQILRLEPI